MATSLHTKGVEPSGEDRGTSSVVDGNCYVKSTKQTSTWEIPLSDVSNDDVCSAIDSGPNVISWDNIDWGQTGVYGSGNDAAPTPRGTKNYPQGDESKELLTNWDKNPFMSIQDGKWKFQYDHGAAERTRMPWYNTTRLRYGFNWQYAVKFIEPINVPAGTTIFMYSQLTHQDPTWCGSRPNRTNAAFRHTPGTTAGCSGLTRVMGGFYQGTSRSSIPTALFPEWGGMVCSQFRYWKPPSRDWKTLGMTNVHWMVFPSMFMGCGPTDSRIALSKFRFRLLALGLTGPPAILTEGIDF